MKVAVVGGGAAGMIAAVFSARNGNETILLEQNEKLGKKLYITGKGRCNLTNACGWEEFFQNIPRNPRFLYSARSFFGPEDIISLVEKGGIPTKTERGKRVFPVSDKSSDIIKALSKTLASEGVSVRLNSRVKEIIVEENTVCGIRIGQEVEPFDAVILATGGLSYPSTGSTGDGFRFAKALGHTVTPLYGSLVPLETEESWCRSLSGLTLKNVTLSAFRGKKQLFSELGEMLFTHFGVSGPLVLSCSALIAEQPAGVTLFIDFKPGLSEEQLDARIIRDIAANTRKSLSGALYGLLPQRLLTVVLEQAHLDAEMSASSFTREQRKTLVNTLKALPLHVKSTRPIEEAIITRGGIEIKEVNPSTMESKIIRNLYFAGEMLDVDGFTGGFNLQTAWATGALAGSSIKEQV